MNTLEKMRRSFGSVLISAIWLNVGLIAARTLWTGEQPAILIGGALLIAAASTATWLNDKVGVATRIVTSMALTMTIILLVFSFSGHPYQVDLHMYFFACLAMTTLWCDWRAQVASAGTTAVHHILLNFLLPSAVYPGGADVLRLVVHAVILVTELGVLIWLSIQLNNLFATGEALLTEASQNARDARAIADERDEARKAQTVAADWRNSQTELFTKRMGDVSEAFIATASKLSVAARSLSTISERTETLTDTVSGVAQKASESTHTVAASTEEMSSSIRDIAAKVAQSSAVANSAAEEAANTETDVRELQVAASKIGEVVDLINNIAGQTNLLALNATIEAARAGESGRGLDVFPSEVKQLASQTAKATEEIAAKIAEIRSATDRTVGSIDKIVATVSQIREISNEISSAIAEQGTATNEIALATQRAADGTSEVTTIILDVGQSAKKTGETSDLLLDLSNGLTRTAEALKLEVTGFVETIQAA